MHLLPARQGVCCPVGHAMPPKPCTAAVHGCNHATALQAFLSRDCPLLQRALPARLRLLFAAGTLSYAAAAATTPLFAAVPVIAVAGGVFPLALTPRLVAAAVPYFFTQHAGALHALAGAPGPTLSHSMLVRCTCWPALWVLFVAQHADVLHLLADALGACSPSLPIHIP